MGRLIDADVLLEYIKKLECHADNKKYEQGLNDCLQFYFPQVIDKQPTAYDVEKVVHELREATKCNIDCYEGRASEVADYDDSWNDDIISACEAIKIVRKGSVE